MSDWRDLSFLLHKRPFKDYFSWVWLLTKEHGVVSACIRESKKNRKGVEPLMTFGCYWCQGREQQILKLNQIELAQAPYVLSGVAAVSGLYVNELIYNTCRNTELVNIFQEYDRVLAGLMLGGQALLIALREFELILLAELGYALAFTDVLASDYDHFHYSPDMGLVGTAGSTKASFSRSHIQAIYDKAWHLPGVLSSAKRLNKMAISHLLDGKSLNCYSWFQEQA